MIPEIAQQGAEILAGNVAADYWQRSTPYGAPINQKTTIDKVAATGDAVETQGVSSESELRLAVDLAEDVHEELTKRINKERTGRAQIEFGGTTDSELFGRMVRELLSGRCFIESGLRSMNISGSDCDWGLPILSLRDELYRTLNILRTQWTPDAAARFLGVSRKTLYRRIKAGKIYQKDTVVRGRDLILNERENRINELATKKRSARSRETTVLFRVLLTPPEKLWEVDLSSFENADASLQPAAMDPPIALESMLETIPTPRFIRILQASLVLRYRCQDNGPHSDPMSEGISGLIARMFLDHNTDFHWNDFVVAVNKCPKCGRGRGLRKGNDAGRALVEEPSGNKKLKHVSFSDLRKTWKNLSESEKNQIQQLIDTDIPGPKKRRIRSRASLRVRKLEQQIRNPPTDAASTQGEQAEYEFEKDDKQSPIIFRCPRCNHEWEKAANDNSKGASGNHNDKRVQEFCTGLWQRENHCRRAPDLFHLPYEEGRKVLGVRWEQSFSNTVWDIRKRFPEIARIDAILRELYDWIHTSSHPKTRFLWPELFNESFTRKLQELQGGDTPN